MSWEFLALLLIEIIFMAIIGLMYAGFVLTVLAIAEFIEKLLWRIKHGKEK